MKNRDIIIIAVLAWLFWPKPKGQADVIITGAPGSGFEGEIVHEQFPVDYSIYEQDPYG